MHPILLVALAVGGFFGFKEWSKKKKVGGQTVVSAAIDSATAAAHAAGNAQAAAAQAQNAANTAATHARNVISLKGIAMQGVTIPAVSTAGWDQFGVAAPPPPPKQAYKPGGRRPMQRQAPPPPPPPPQPASASSGSSDGSPDGSSDGSSDDSGDAGYEGRKLRYSSPAHRVLHKRTDIRF